MKNKDSSFLADELIAHVEKLIAEGKAMNYTTCLFHIRNIDAINDQLGLEIGTELVRNYLELIRDRLGSSGFVVRVAGNTYFSIFFDGFADSMVKWLSETEVESRSGVSKVLSSYAGFYSMTEQCRSFREVKDILNEALRQASNHSDGTTHAFCDDTLLQTIRDAHWVEGMFSSAIENEEFIVYYQPKVETKRYHLRGAEALCRWVHNGEMILPYRFIPVYEHNGYICELDFYMLEHVCLDIRRWIDEGFRVVRTSVNFSREHMGDPDLVERIVEIIDRYSVPHRYIEVELTETSTEVDYRELKDVVSKLHQAGIHTSVDDFGVGYSSMNLLTQLPWDVVKIDRSFVPLGTGDEEDQKRFVMMRSIISMAKELDLECIAEGVETVDQMILLKQNGCTLIQGYLFDKPLPKDEYEKRLAELTRINRKEQLCVSVGDTDQRTA